jgi:UDP-N-acetylmuramoyl-L-alanyl-D-glutamate--2,6-diaminopimelate ligase
MGSVGDRTQCRRRELGDVASSLSDFTYLTADNPGFEDVESICREIATSFANPMSYQIIPDRAEAIRTALEGLCPGDVLLLAGKGDERFQAVCGRLEPHSDREAAQAVLDELSLRI